MEDSTTGRPIDEILVDLAVLTLKPGDTLVVLAKDKLSNEYIERIAEVAKDFFPSNRCLVLDAGLTLAVIHEEPNQEGP